MKTLLRLSMAALLALPCGGAVADPVAPSLGSPEFKPAPDRPVGWRGDWSGRFTGATPPTTWSRRVRGITTALRYEAGKPAGDPTKDSKALEYFSIKDWLVTGPIAVQDPVKDIEQDFLGGEPAVQPADCGKAAGRTWEFLRADIATQSRHDHNQGTCGQRYADFVYAFGKFSPDGPGR